jgi:hypothetical protein
VHDYRHLHVVAVLEEYDCRTGQGRGGWVVWADALGVPRFNAKAANAPTKRTRMTRRRFMTLPARRWCRVEPSRRLPRIPGIDVALQAVNNNSVRCVFCAGRRWGHIPTQWDTVRAVRSVARPAQEFLVSAVLAMRTQVWCQLPARPSSVTPDASGH